MKPRNYGGFAHHPHHAHANQYRRGQQQAGPQSNNIPYHGLPHHNHHHNPPPGLSSLGYHTIAPVNVRRPLEDPDSEYGVDEHDFPVFKGDKIAGKYEILRIMGSGSFGKVVECVDLASKKNVAIKISKLARDCVEEFENEIKVMEEIAKSDPEGKYNCARLTEWFNWNGHLCMVVPKYGMSLYHVLKKTKFRPFALETVKCIARQLYRTLSFLHSIKWIHADIKPENILFMEDLPTDAHGVPMVPANPRIVLIDFGSTTHQHLDPHDPEIGTACYQSPEMLLNLEWSYPIDVYGATLVILELHTGQTVFNIHSDEREKQLMMMQQLTGPLPHYMAIMAHVPHKSIFSPPGGPMIPRLVQVNDPAFVDLLIQGLTLDPHQRISAVNALSHPFVMNAPKPAALSASSSAALVHKSEQPHFHAQQQQQQQQQQQSAAPVANSNTNNNNGDLARYISEPIEFQRTIDENKSDNMFGATQSMPAKAQRSIPSSASYQNLASAAAGAFGVAAVPGQQQQQQQPISSLPRSYSYDDMRQNMNNYGGAVDLRRKSDDTTVEVLSGRPSIGGRPGSIGSSSSQSTQQFNAVKKAWAADVQEPMTSYPRAKVMVDVREPVTSYPKHKMGSHQAPSVFEPMPSKLFADERPVSSSSSSSQGVFSAMSVPSSIGSVSGGAAAAVAGAVVPGSTTLAGSAPLFGSSSNTNASANVNANVNVNVNFNGSGSGKPVAAAPVKNSEPWAENRNRMLGERQQLGGPSSMPPPPPVNYGLNNRPVPMEPKTMNPPPTKNPGFTGMGATQPAVMPGMYGAVPPATSGGHGHSHVNDENMRRGQNWPGAKSFQAWGHGVKPDNDPARFYNQSLARQLL